MQSAREGVLGGLLGSSFFKLVEKLEKPRQSKANNDGKPFAGDQVDSNLGGVVIQPVYRKQCQDDEVETLSSDPWEKKVFN